MKTRNSVRVAYVVVFGFLLIGLLCSTVSAVSLDIKLQPPEIKIGETFRGAPMSIMATVPPENLYIIEIKGESHTHNLLRKGRVAGLWMNVGEIKVQAAPSMYLALTNKSGPSLDKELGTSFGYASLKKTIHFLGKADKSERDLLLDQFLKLKKSQGLYNIFPGAIRVKETGTEGSKIQANVNLPCNIAPGSYQVVLSVVKDNKLIEQEITEFQVKLTGLPKVLSSMAFEQPLLYGSLAVIIAIVCGFLMGFIFGGKGAH